MTIEKPDKGIVLSERASFVRETAQTLATQADYSVGRLTLILGTYVAWAEGVRGLPLVADLLFDPQVIDLYIRDAVREKRLSKSSVGSYRSVLMRASEVFLPRDGVAKARPVGAQLMLAPYSPSEVDAFPTWARGQRTQLMQDKAVALMCLGLGCGLRAGEILSLRRGDVQDGIGVTVYVHNRGMTRAVPMVTRWEGTFRQLIAARNPDDFVFGRPTRAINPNSISEFLANSGPKRMALSTVRMRTTWILGRLMAGVDLRTLLDAAGLDRLEKLADYTPYLPAPTAFTRSQLVKETH